jgi:hypothetical protein
MRASLIKVFSSQLSFLLLILIICIGVSVRLVNLELFPAQGDTYDEYYWTFFGASLLETGTPQSWSYFERQDFEVRIIQDVYYQFVTPSFDHPPLFALFPGFLQVISNKVWDDPAPLLWLRLSGLPIWIANISLMYLVGKKMANSKTGLFTALLYAVTPIIVFSNRLIVSENLLSTFLLAFLYLSILPSTTHRKFGLVIITVLTILTKISGLAIIAAAFVHLVMHKDKDWKWIIVGGVIGAVSLLIYVCSYDIRTFFLIQSIQGQRYNTLANLPILFFLSQKLTSRMLIDGITLVGKISIFILAFTPKLSKLKSALVLQTLFQAGFIFIAVGETYSFNANESGGFGLYGWYTYTLFPLILLSLTSILRDLIQTENKIGMALCMLFLSVQFRFFFYYTGFVDMNTNSLSKFAPVLLFTVCFGSFLFNNKLWRWYIFSFLALLIAVATFESVTMNDAFYQEDSWYTSTLIYP